LGPPQLAWGHPSGHRVQPAALGSNPPRRAPTRRVGLQPAGAGLQPRRRWAQPTSAAAMVQPTAADARPTPPAASLIGAPGASFSLVWGSSDPHMFSCAFLL